MFKIKNPILLFVIIWLFVLFIYSKRYSLVLTTLTNDTKIYVILACLCFVLSYFFVSAIFHRNKTVGNKTFSQNTNIQSGLNKVLVTWVFFTIIEITYFKGLPLLGILGLGGDSGAYTEWGIPSLHGFLNAMIILLSNYFIYFFIKTKDKKYIYFFILCIFWPILLITRQMLLSMIIQASFIYILIKEIKVKSIILFLCVSILVIYIFGVVGDLRSGSEAFLEIVQPSDEYPSWLPSGFLWVYVYMVSPLNNVNFNLGKYPDFNFDLTPLVSPLFPSFIRDKFFSYSNQFNFQLVNDNLNVSTMFPTYLSSFGYFGSLIFYFILGLVISFALLKFQSRNANIGWVFFLAIIFHNLIFSVFVDFFFNLIFIFQIILHIYLSYKIKFVRGKN
jgi:oligosaccharide repeat unit polymerase